MNKTNSKIKAVATTMITLLCLTATTAHADFRKALDAYIARDGDTMLKEVKDAVDKKNDDGLVLFLSVLERDSIFSQNFSFLFEEKTGIMLKCVSSHQIGWVYMSKTIFLG